MSLSMGASPELSKGTAASEKATRYRWVVMATIFAGYVICMADRSNIGAVLPFVKAEFHIDNFTSGAISSFFFLGYAVSQIPAGLLIGKKGTRTIVSLAILAFSIVTFLMGFTAAAVGLLVLRLFLGLAEGPVPVGMTSTVNAWFPPREKGTATGLYIASTQFAPIIVPAIAIAIASAFGWRTVFFWFAIPGVLMAAVWYFIVRNRPEQHPRVNAAEVAHIYDTTVEAKKVEFRPMGWLDKLIRLKDVDKLETNGQVLRSWNVWGDTLAYFFMNNVNYGLLTWVPLYLVQARHFDFTSTGFIAAAPAVGGLLGAMTGGFVSDRVFQGRRKPTMLITAFFAAVMMVTVINAPQNTALIVASLMATGFFLNIGWPMFTAYPMGLTNNKTYPFAISVINSGGNLGGFFAPMIVGALLDATGSNYGFAFSYFVVVLLLAFVVIFTLVEAKPKAAESALAAK
ncbi:MAG: MFS transporter [Propionicimonas sp.]|uniref:MFS transporter n=1 Tax=Propionicimonas sp. TaxID=1955623 RepID=UPI003D0A43F6